MADWNLVFQSRELTEQQESMLSQKNSQISHLEDKLRASNADKEAVLCDLAAVREICVKLDSAKDNLSRMLAKKNLENDQVSWRKASSFVFIKVSSNDLLRHWDHMVSISVSKIWYYCCSAAFFTSNQVEQTNTRWYRNKNRLESLSVIHNTAKRNFLQNSAQSKNNGLKTKVFQTWIFYLFKQLLKKFFFIPPLSKKKKNFKNWKKILVKKIILLFWLPET